MTDDEHERLVRLEVLQGKIQEDVSEIKTTVAKFERLQARMGGIVLGFVLIASLVTWVLSNAKAWLSMPGP